MENKHCLGETIPDLISALKPLAESYRMLVGAADEFNKITLAHKNDLEDAIHRADDLGDVIDKLIKTLDILMGKELYRIRHEEENAKTQTEGELQE